MSEAKSARNELRAELLRIELSVDRSRWADALVELGYSKRPTIGFIVVDAETRAIDWDMELHPSEEAAIESLTGPLHMYCRSVDEETEDKTFWRRHYTICPVLEAAS